MIEQLISDLEDMLLSENGFLVEIRLGKGASREKFQKILVKLKEIHDELKGIDSIPKSLSMLFFDLPSSMMSSGYSYDEKEANEIFQYADQLSGQIRKILI